MQFVTRQQLVRYLCGFGNFCTRFGRPTPPHANVMNSSFYTYPSISGTSLRIRRTTSKFSPRCEDTPPGDSEELGMAIHMSSTTTPMITNTIPAHGRTCISYTAVKANADDKTIVLSRGKFRFPQGVCRWRGNRKTSNFRVDVFCFRYRFQNIRVMSLAFFNKS